MEKMKLGTISLKVNQLERQRDYYRDVIGLHVIEETLEKVDLGIEETGEILVSLLSSVDNSSKNVTGLYHLALLLPSRVSFSGFLRHLLEIKAPLIGAADHGYSEALYLEDLEGNGIEIYCDKPVEKWNILSNGQIKGTTLEMNSEEIILLTDRSLTKMPLGTKMGHVHLTVSSLEANELFYCDILGFDLVDNLEGHARFFSVDGYHHHVGVNNWQGNEINKRKTTNLGINFFQMLWQDEVSFNQMKNKLIKHQIKLSDEADNQFSVLDPNGIKIQMSLN